MCGHMSVCVCVLWLCGNARRVSLSLLGLAAVVPASPVLRRADLSTLGSGISTNLSFVLLQNRLFCVLFSAGHCALCFLVSALIHTVTQNPPDPLRYPPYLAFICPPES